ncbi:unnamed protein product [Discula destructiva]
MAAALDTRRPEQYPYFYSSRGTVYYTPRESVDRRARRVAAAALPSLPAPHIGPRQRRPHSIHIVSYPSGFIPHDLRPKTAPRDQERQRRKEEERKKKEEECKKKTSNKQKKQRDQEEKTKSRQASAQDKRKSFPLFNKLKAAFSSNESQQTAGPEVATAPTPRTQIAGTRVRPVSWLSVASRHSRAEDATTSGEDSPPPSTDEPIHQPIAALQSASRRATIAPYVPISTLSPALEESAQPRAAPVVASSSIESAPATRPTTSHPPVTSHRPTTSSRPSTSNRPDTARSLAVQPITRTQSAMVDVPHRHSAMAGFGNPQRNSFMSVRSAKNVVSSSVQEIQQSKPVASGNGLSCTILLAEPNVFLTGFDHDGHTRYESHNSTALLRGKLQLNVSKNTKVKSITLKLLGKARTEWPEGIPPLKVDMYEEESLRTQALTFFHAMHDGWETDFGNQCTYVLKGNSSSTNLTRPSTSPRDSIASLQLGGRPRTNMTAKELKKLSLRSVESRSFGKGDSPAVSQMQPRGFKVFYPGTYEYSFELPIDHHQLETIKLQYGSVKWELETTIERTGAFKPNLHGTKEVSIVRVPDQMSLETTEPISISRQWEDQLHYDIMISGKSFPIGSRIPIAFKLTPLAKVQVHKVKIFVTESIEYWTNDRKVTRKDPGRKILLLEKAAGKPLDKQYETSEFRIISGGELSPDERFHARESAARRRTIEGHRSGTAPQPLPEPTENLLGDLDLGLETYWGSTEMEMNVQMPTCEMMAKDKSKRMNPDCSWKNVNVYHWMKIVMRISRIDPDDPTGKRRRHFEISIDSPFTVLNCRATQANTALPRYNSPEMAGDYRTHTSCGCPDARVLSHTGSTPENTSGTLVDNAALPMPPQAAHLHNATQASSSHSRADLSATAPTTASTSSSGTGSSTLTSAANPLQRVRDQDASARPIHLIRYPSFDPPPFHADEAPPPMPTPPPNYDLVVGTPSVDGMADYFKRLSYFEDLTQAQDAPAALEYLSGANGSGEASTSRTAHAPANDNDDGEDTETEGDSDSDSEHRPARTVSRAGTVNIANPRTPGGRLVPSRSFEIERPVNGFTLNMAGVVRRGAAVNEATRRNA